MTEFETGDTVAVFYFNARTGEPSEKMLTVEHSFEKGYQLSETLGSMEYRFDTAENQLHILRPSGEALLGTDAKISPPTEDAN